MITGSEVELGAKKRAEFAIVSSIGLILQVVGFIYKWGGVTAPPNANWSSRDGRPGPDGVDGEHGADGKDGQLSGDLTLIVYQVPSNPFLVLLVGQNGGGGGDGGDGGSGGNGLRGAKVVLGKGIGNLRDAEKGAAKGGRGGNAGDGGDGGQAGKAGSGGKLIVKTPAKIQSKTKRMISIDSRSARTGQAGRGGSPGQVGSPGAGGEGKPPLHKDGASGANGTTANAGRTPTAPDYKPQRPSVEWVAI